MALQKSVTQLMQALPKAQGALIAIAAIYAIYSFKKTYVVTDEAINTVAEPLGRAWSDISAWAGGWTPVELTDLIIQPWYMDNNYRLTDEAFRVLGKAYPAEVKQFFSNRVLKSHYRHLIGKPIKAN